MPPRKARCPKCRQAIDLDSVVDGTIVCPHCQSSLREPARGKTREDPLPGTNLGQYEILELLGRGGMGSVYKARQTSLDRLCALKVLPAVAAKDANFVARFQREARAAAVIGHPNIVQVYDVGQADGTHYIAMEFVDGEHLGARLKRDGAIPPAEALDMLKQVASALAAAQALNIIHRDLKPANILIDVKGRVKVADFGLAKQSGTDVTVTAAGTKLGTPLYFSPEMARGEKADGRSDLYSLGATFYHLVAGSSPFQGRSMADTMLKHLNEEPPPLGEAVPGAPPELVRAIHRLLQKMREDRYQTAQELLDDLEGKKPRPAAEADDESPLRRHLSLEERREARRKRQRRNAMIIVAVVSVLAVAAILVVILSR